MKTDAGRLAGLVSRVEFEELVLEVIKVVGGYAGYGVGALFFWWLYPHTLSKADLFQSSALNYWVGRVVFAATAPWITMVVFGFGFCSVISFLKRSLEAITAF